MLWRGAETDHRQDTLDACIGVLPVVVMRPRCRYRRALADSVTPYYGSWLKGPLNATVGGKSALLLLPAEQRRALLGPGPWPALTAHTLTTWKALEANLRQSVERGYVVWRDEHLLSITNVAALMPRLTGAAAGCLIASARSDRLDEDGVNRVGLEAHRAAGMLVYQMPSLESACCFCGR